MRKTTFQTLARTLALASLALLAATTAQSREASEVQPLLIGAKIPDVAVTDASGNTASLPDLLSGQNTALVFYRGGWCPFCVTQLQGLAEVQQELKAMGYQVVAISPDAPDNLSSAIKGADLGYRLYSDSSLAASDAFGLSFSLDAATLAKYKQYGIDLGKASGGQNQERLPVPAVFLVTPDNEISFTHVDPNYRFRLSSEVLLAAAKAGLDFHTKK